MHSQTARYAVALVALAAAVLLRWLLDPVMGDALPLVTVFGAVAVGVWVGGWATGIVVSLVGYAACDFLFIAPRGSLLLGDTSQVVGLVAYLVTCSIIIGFGEALRVERNRSRERGDLLSVTLQSIGDAVITTDVEGRVTGLNAVAEELTGFTERDAVGLPLDEVFRIRNEDTREPAASPATRALREGAVVGLANHTVLIHRDGSERPIDDSASPIRDEHGRVAGCVLVFRDVAEQRRAERERAQQLLTARLLAAIVESSDDAIISKSLDGVIKTWNVGAERLFGYTPEQAIGRHISLVIPPELRAEADQIIARLRQGLRIEHYETERVCSDGRRIRVSLTISPIRDEEGRVVGASKIARDVTRQREADERERRLLAAAAEASAERQNFVTLTESSRDFIGMCDLDGLPSFVNQAGLELVGLDSLEQARRTPVPEFFFPEDQARVMEEFFPAVRERGHGEIEVRFRHFKTGAALWMAYKLVTLSDAQGRPTGFATVSQDISERKQLEDDLRRLAEDLALVNRRKDEFLAMLAHELRNSLAPISNAVHVLRLGGGDAASVRPASEMLARQVGQMARLVDDLLDVSRITRGRIELRRERVDLAVVLAQAVESVQPMLQCQHHEFSLTLPAETVWLDADPARLVQAVGNLLNNACKFTDRGGHIRLAAERVGGEAVIRVRDDGIGIAAEQMPRLFEMFVQVDASLERSRDGLGIGLTLVKSLVEMHGGTVVVQSEGLGRGSEFTIRLPVVAAPASRGAGPAVRAATAANRRRVLIVDDDEDGAQSLALLLRLDGHETHTAHDGLAALEAAERLRPDVVLLDIGLPRLNGYDACRRMREQAWGRDLLLVALTGWGQSDDRQRSREAGFDDHLVKPVDHERLARLMRGAPRASVE